MASKSNYAGTVVATAPAGGVTAGTVVFNAAYRTLLLPLTSATSGATTRRRNQLGLLATGRSDSGSR